MSILVFPGSVPSRGYDGAGLRSHCRDQSVLLWFLGRPSAGQEDCHHLQAVFRTAQFSGTDTLYTDNCHLPYVSWYFGTLH